MIQNPELSLAPFQGITSKSYRNAFARHFGGFDSMYTPFISGAGTERINPSKLSDVLPLSHNLAPTVPQLISTDAREIILFGKTLQDHGYDHINWNLGCPFSRIANKKRGCGMLPYPDELDSILEQVFKEIPVKLSIKTRLGYFHKDEIKRIIEVINRYPVHLLILHPRIGTQVYSGIPDTQAFAHTLGQTTIPMAYNGDIYHLTRFRELQAMFPQVNNWMIGRGALINPFLPQQIKGLTHSDEEKRNRLHNFHNELLENSRHTSTNVPRLVGSMKAVWYYMTGVFTNGREIFANIKKSKDMSAYLEAVNNGIDQQFADDASLEDYFKMGIKHIGGG